MANKIVAANKDLGNNGKMGGIFKGDRHSAPSGGIEVQVEGSSQKILVEDSEPILIPSAVNSNKTVSFDGKKMKPKEVISKINTDFGGVPIKKKGGFIDAKAEIKRLKDIRDKKENGGLVDKILSIEETKKYLQKKYPKRLVTYDAISKEADIYADKELHKEGFDRYSKAGLSKFWQIGGKKKKELEKQYNGDLVELWNGFVEVYVRLGLPPTNKNKKIVNSTGFNDAIGLGGVSVFRAGYDPKTKFVVIDTGGNTLTMDWYEGLAQKRKLYLVEGKEMDEEGYDGEPLLNPKTLEVIGELDADFVVTDLSSFDYETASGKEVEIHPIKILEQGGNISTNEQPIKVKAGSVVVTRDAILNDEKHEYNGEVLTNKEILSKINHDIGGGVEFAEGGNVESDCGCNHTMQNGGLIDAIELSKNNLQKNGLVLKSHDKSIIVLAYNTGGQEFNPSLYNLRLIRDVVAKIDNLKSNELVSIFVNQISLEKFDVKKLDEYKQAKHLIICNQNEVVYNSNDNFESGGLIPQQGTLYTKDKTSKLEYQKKGNDYVFKVYDVENNPVENYTRNQYKKRGNNEAIMNYKQFINYLYAELYIDDKLEQGGNISDHEETYKKWKSLVNMSKSELENFYNSEEGKEAGLTSEKANELGIHSGRESAKWVMKMKDTPHQEWTPTMWDWANRQISFISRMSGNKGGLYDDKGNKTRKHTSLLIWGHNPEKFESGGNLIKRADGTYSKHGLWDSIRENEGSGRKPTKEMLEQEEKIKANSMANGGEFGINKNPDKINYRIVTEDYRIKYAGTGHDSWFTLDKARKLVDYSKGEMIYEYNYNGDMMWEVFENGGELKKEDVMLCENCGWTWKVADSTTIDKYICYGCGHNNYKKSN